MQLMEKKKRKKQKKWVLEADERHFFTNGADTREGGARGARGQIQEDVTDNMNRGNSRQKFIEPAAHVTGTL